MKIFKKTLCTLLIVVLCLTGVPLQGFVGIELPDFGECFASEVSAVELAPTGQCGENVYWNYDSSTGELVISGIGPMTDYFNNGFQEASPFSYTDIKTLIVENGITVIGLGTFEKCSELTKVELPDSIIRIRGSAFSECPKLVDINIPTNVEYIEHSVFSGCSALLQITIPDSVTKLGSSAFYDCGSLKTVIIGTGLSSMSDDVFGACSNLEKFIVDENNNYYSSDNNGVLFNKSKTSIIKYPIGNKETSYEVPESVTEIAEYSFNGINNLNTITLGSNVNNIHQEAFYDSNGFVNIFVNPLNEYYASDEYGVLFNKEKTKLIMYPAKNERESYTIPDSVVEIANGAFRKAENLTSIDIHDNIVTVGDNAFVDCFGLTNVTIGKGLTTIENGPFGYCDSIENFEVDINNNFYSSDSYGVLFNKDKTTLIRYPIGNDRKTYEIPDSVTSIADFSFSDSKLKNVIIGKNVTEIGAAFDWCYQLESITIPGSVKIIQSAAFSGCENLATLIIEDGVEVIGNGTFADCTSLITVTLPESMNYIGSGAFQDCINLKTIVIPVGVESIEVYTFDNCPSLTDVYYTGSKEQWDEMLIEGRNEALTNATIHYESKDSNELVSDKNYSISAYSSKSKLALLPGKELSMLFKLNFDDGRNKYIVANSSFNFTVSDDDVISIENIVSSSDQTSLIVKTHNSGTAVLTVSAYENGEYKTISKYTIDVFGTDVYHANNFEYTEGDINHNFISNGVFIDDFQIEYNEDDTCNVTFTAYNTENAIAIASVYDSKGKLLKTKNIDRFFGEAPTDLYDTATGLYENLPDLFSDDPLYQQSIWSEETKVAFKNIPCTGRIEITNDCSISINAALNNYCSIFIATLCEYISLADYIGSIPDFKVNTMATQKMVDIVENAISKLAEDEAMLITDYILNLGLNLSDEMSIVDGSMLEYVEAFEMFLGVLIRLNIGFDEIIDILYETLVDVGMGVIESAFFDALKLPGALMEAAFMCFRAADITDHYQTVGKFIGSGETSVYLDNKEDRYALSSNDYTVSGEWYFDSAVSFHQYMITSGEDLDDVNENFDDFTHVQVIGMSLYKNGKEIQPNGEVEVAIPIPSGVIIDTLEIYRKEDNGAYTKLDYVVDGNYLIFKTHHFSVYCIVGEYEKIDSLSLFENSITVELNELVKLHEIVSGAVGGKNLVWSTSDADIVKVSDIGVIRGLKDGVATITVATADGALTASCVVTVVHEHSFGEWVEIKTANCTEFGIQQHNCLLCDYFETKTSSALGHSFEDGESKCNNCSYNRADSCSCKCHSTSFITKIIWKLTIFFNKIFKKNQICSCGIYHY